MSYTQARLLGAIYAVMMSVGQLNRLVELSNDTENPIRSMQLSAVKAEEAAPEAAPNVIVPSF